MLRRAEANSFRSRTPLRREASAGPGLKILHPAARMLAKAPSRHRPRERSRRVKGSRCLQTPGSSTRAQALWNRNRHLFPTCAHALRFHTGWGGRLTRLLSHGSLGGIGRTRVPLFRERASPSEFRRWRYRTSGEACDLFDLTGAPRRPKGCQRTVRSVADVPRTSEECYASIPPVVATQNAFRLGFCYPQAIPRKGAAPPRRPPLTARIGIFAGNCPRKAASGEGAVP